MRAYLLGQDLNVPVSVISVVGAKGAGLNTFSAPGAGGAKVFVILAAGPRSAHQVLCRDRDARSHQVLWLQFLAAMAILMHLGEIFVSGGIRKVTHWPSSRRLWRCSEAGGPPTSAARPARPAAL